MAEIETPIKSKITVQTAVRAAENFVQNMKRSLGELSDVRLEEVVLTEDESYWLITLGFMRPESNVLEKPKREYRQFQIDATTGNLKSMTIRTV